ncbi:MAG: glycosyltransferase family 4 protein [Bacteroidetes bacterium]|nr:glycosyltransferase family 4 protein [Bacteroidota bacterium]
MVYPLAIIAPHIGARSETFIQRHMDSLAPERTVVIAQSADPPHAGHWDVDAPQLILNKMRRHRPLSFLAQQLTTYTGVTVDILNNREKHVVRFLAEHGVTAILGEYLNFSHPYIKIARQCGIRFYAHAHGYDVSRMLKDQQWREKYRDYNDADGVITMNSVSRQRLIELGIQQEKIHIIPYGIDIQSSHPARAVTSNECVRCLAVGRMVAKKAPLLLLESFRQAVSTDSRLHMDYIGEGPLLEAVIAYVQKFALQNCVTLHKGQSNAVVKQFMEKADIFLQHSITDPETGDEEGLPVAILEAMASGLPVVSTLHAGIPEAVIEGKTGYLVEEGHTEAMAENILQLAQNPELREQFGDAGWQRAKQYFSWEVERTKLIKILNLPV